MAAHSSLPVSRFVDSRGLELGWALGDIFGPGIERPGEDIILPDQSDVQPTWFGRYLIVRVEGGKGRIYPDSCASLGAVFSKAHELAASTVTIGMMTAGAADGWDLGLDVLGPNNGWPCGLTASPAFRRLLPNHYCDLESWASARRGPPISADRLAVSRALSDASGALVDYVGQIVRRYSNVYLPLTAGVDSRAIAAAVIAGGHAKSIECVTFSYEGSSDTSDRDGAAAIAGRFGLSHRTIMAPHVDEKTKRDYQLRTGFSGHWGKSRDFYAACLESLDMSAAWMPGFLGELGRGHRWKRDPPRLSRTIPIPDELDYWPRDRTDCRVAVTDWLSGLPLALNRWAVFDLAELEIVTGCWACPHLYGAAPFRAQLLPWGHPAVIESAFALPDSYRRSGAFNKHIIAKLAPGLLQIPFGSHAGSPDTLRRKASRLRFRYPSLWPVLSLLRRRSYREVGHVEEAKDSKV